MRTGTTKTGSGTYISFLPESSALIVYIAKSGGVFATHGQRHTASSFTLTIAARSGQPE